MTAEDLDGDDSIEAGELVPRRWSWVRVAGICATGLANLSRSATAFWDDMTMAIAEHQEYRLFTESARDEIDAMVSGR